MVEGVKWGWERGRWWLREGGEKGISLVPFHSVQTVNLFRTAIGSRGAVREPRCVAGGGIRKNVAS